MNSFVTVRNVSFALPNGRELFQNVSFSLDVGLTALVGPNGIGKTTLARLVGGLLEPTTGTIHRQGPVVVFSQRENPTPIAVETFLAAEYTWSARGESLLQGIDRSALCTTLSGGQWMRVRLARVLREQFLILDEPTNDLDDAGRNAMVQFLRNHESGALLISHDRQCLALCNNILELSNRGLTKFGGGWAAYTTHKEKEREGLRKALEHAKRERDRALSEHHTQQARQEKRNRRGAEASARGGQAKILLGGRKSNAQVATGKATATSLARASDAVHDVYKAFQEVKVDPVMYADLLGCEIPAQKLVAEASDFNICLNRWLYGKNLQFSWRGNIRIALKGENGAGKSTLVQAVLGAAFETRGTLRKGNLVTLAIDQRCASLDDDKSIFENIRDVAMLSESEIRSGLARFLFTKEAVFQKASQLSGGERLRAALAKGFLSRSQPELLILDEPTNNLDLPNVEFLEKLVREFRGALIVVSHDETFLQNCGIQQELVLTA